MADAPDFSGFCHLQAVVFDWAGTTVDCGCCGPVEAFIESFAAFGIAVTTAEAREPMGRDKREHVIAMLAMPRITALWQDKYGRVPAEEDIDAVYERVQDTMTASVIRYSAPIAGALDAVAAMREGGLRIGSCTGYPRAVAEQMATRAGELGYAPDCLVCATDVARSRPAPDMCLEALKKMGCNDPSRCVKIGDTVADMQEGKSAGCWTIGITLTGSEVGLSREELAALSEKETLELETRAENILRNAGADYVARDLPSCLAILRLIELSY